MAKKVLFRNPDSGNCGGYCRMLNVIAVTTGTVTAFGLADNKLDPGNTACPATPLK